MITSVLQTPDHVNLQPSIKTEIIDFYNEATEDYKFWSKDMNMHFGFFKLLKTNPFKRDSMLNEMNNHLFSLLDIQHRKAHVVDLGCGVGATMKYGINLHSKLAISGCTLSNVQLNIGKDYLNSDRATLLNYDYRHTQFKSNTFDGALAIESFCHSGCSPKALIEAHRILKPGAKLVIADAFSKKPKEKMNPLSKKVYQGLCTSWRLEKLGDINNTYSTLKKLGFRDILVRNIWHRVAPSVLHVPFAISGFLLKKRIKGDRLKKESIANLKGSFYALLTSLCLQDFGYYTITAKK